MKRCNTGHSKANFLHLLPTYERLMLVGFMWRKGYETEGGSMGRASQLP